MNPWKMMTDINYKKLNAWMWFIFLCLIIVMSFALVTLHRWIGEPSSAFHVVMLIFTFCLLITILMAVCMYLILKSHEKSKSLFDNEQHYKMILDSIKDNAIFTLTPLGHVKSWNIGAQRVYGYSEKEIVGRHSSLFYPHEDIARGIPTNIITIAQKKGKFEGEAIRIRKDGSPFWAHILMEPIYNDKQRLAGFVNIIRDVTENRKMEEEHSRLIALIEESSDFVGIADLQGNLLYHNRSAKRMVGLPDDYDMSSMKISDMHPYWAVQKVINEVIPTAFEKGFWTGELALLHCNGREIPVLQSVTLHRNAMGEPACLTTIARDITERKAAEDATKASEEIFRSAMQHAATGMALISPTGKWLNVNHSMCTMLGYSEEELLQSDFQTLTYPDDLETDLENVLLMLNKQIDNYQMEKRYIHKDGHLVWGLLSVSLVWDNDGTPKYFVSLVQNISYRKKAEAANKKLLQALESSNAELERFAYVASHDLQEPIRMINNFGELLLTEKQDKLDEEGKEYLKIMTDAGLRMRAVINDLLAYSRIHEDSENIFFDGESILKSALENIKALIEEQKAEVTHEPLPTLYGNPMQIMRVLQNLITNAIKYQAPGNIPVIHIGIEDADPYWKITIQDNGLGIDEQFIKEIFEPFRRLHAWDSIKGSGLGLSICKKIAENHNGSLSVTSRVGIGSNFTLTLPKHDNILHA